MKNKRLIIVIAVIILVVVGGGLYLFLSRTQSNNSASTYEVKEESVTERISVTGVVETFKGVDLSFERQGRVVANYVKAGDKVYAGQTLAAIDSSDLAAQLNSAQAGIDSAQASYQKIINGATPETIQTFQDAVNLAGQDLDNAYNGSVSILNDAYAKTYNAYNFIISLQIDYFFRSDQQGVIFSEGENNIKDKMADMESVINANSDESIDSAVSSVINDLKSVFDSLEIIREQCDSGDYYSRVSSTDKVSLDTQKSYINTAISTVSSLQQKIASAKISLQKAQSQLVLAKAPAREEDIALAKAAVDMANANVKSIKAQISKTIIIAPFSGNIDKDDVLIGSISVPNSPAIRISDENFEVETDIPEIDIARIKEGKLADVTLDAYGNSVVFKAEVYSVDSSQTLVNGIPVYKARLKFSKNDERIKPGMTANVSIISETRDNVLVVPQAAVIQQDGKSFVFVDKGNSTKEQREVEVGISGNGNVEIISGLNLGEKIFIY
jgi:HlyD family secretion protein